MSQLSAWLHERARALFTNQQHTPRFVLHQGGDDANDRIHPT
jgi:hypothetical protein